MHQTLETVSALQAISRASLTASCLLDLPDMQQDMNVYLGQTRYLLFDVCRVGSGILSAETTSA